MMGGLGMTLEKPMAAAAVQALSLELRQMGEPRHFYQGLKLSGGFFPDNLLMFGRNSWRGLHKEATVHSRHVLIVAIQGGGTLVLDGKGVELNSGCGLLVFPFQSHAYASLKEPLEWLFITFSAANDQAIQSLRARPFRFPAAALATLAAMAAEYRQAAEDPERIAGLAMELRQLLLSSREWLEPLAAVDSRTFRLLSEIEAFVEARLHRGVRIKEVAAHFGLSTTTLSAKFRQQFGSSLGQYLQRLRLARALKLLVSTDHKIEEIAQRSGFDSSYAFGRAFRRTFRITPSHYRRHCREVGAATSLAARGRTR